MLCCAKATADLPLPADYSEWGFPPSPTHPDLSALKSCNGVQFAIAIAISLAGKENRCVSSNSNDCFLFAAEHVTSFGKEEKFNIENKETKKEITKCKARKVKGRVFFIMNSTHPNKNTVCANNFGAVCENCPPYSWKTKQKQPQKELRNLFVQIVGCCFAPTSCRQEIRVFLSCMKCSKLIKFD